MKTQKVTHFFVTRSLCFVALLVMITGVCEGADQTGRLDITLVIDSSGSMRGNDKENLRIIGAKQVTDLARKGDIIRLREFSITTSLVATPTEIKHNKSRHRIKKQAELIGSDGGATDITKALDVAFKDLVADQRTDYRRYVVLLTDGKIEIPGGAGAKKASHDRLLNELVPLYAGKGWPIYTIGLSENVDAELLKAISERTKQTVAGKEKGFYEQTNIATDIPHIYTKMFAQMADWVSIYRGEGDGVIKLDKRMDERVIFVLDKKPGTIPLLVLPDGKTATSGNKRGFHWSTADAYDILTKEKPKSGVYQIKFDGEGVISCYSQSAFWVNFYPIEKNLHERREAVKIRASLMQDQSPYHDTEKTKLLEGALFVCEVALPGGGSTKACTLYDDGSRGDDKPSDGIYTGYFGQTDHEGDYRALVRAKGRTFERASDVQIFSLKGGPSFETTVDKQSYNKNEPIQIAAKMHIPSTDMRLIVDCFDSQGKYDFLELKSAADAQSFSQKFASTTTFGEYTFLVRAQGQKQDGTTLNIIQKLLADVGNPDIILKASQDLFSNIFGLSGTVIAITAESRLNVPEVLHITKPTVENLEFQASQQREVWDAPADEKILLRPGGTHEIFVAMRTTVRPSKEQKEGEVTVTFTPQRNPNAYVEPSHLTFHYYIDPPMKGWQKMVLFGGLPLIVVILGGFMAIQLRRLPLRGQLILESIGRRYTLRNRGFLGLRKTMTLGTGKCDIRLQDDEGQIKPIHAKLSRTKHGSKTRLLFVELATKNRRLLKDQDEITIGKHKLRYQNFKDK